mmetsp:Transcript_66764/g.92890  ORF Transcript_66764/g.92890 Transcript_66764/m.92890 type:complete len:327 (+) Transcript_66764:480-1460(+)
MLVHEGYRSSHFLFGGCQLPFSPFAPGFAISALALTGAMALAVLASTIAGAVAFAIPRRRLVLVGRLTTSTILRLGLPLSLRLPFPFSLFLHLSSFAPNKSLRTLNLLGLLNQRFEDLHCILMLEILQDGKDMPHMKGESEGDVGVYPSDPPHEDADLFSYLLADIPMATFENFLGSISDQGVWLVHHVGVALNVLEELHGDGLGEPGDVPTHLRQVDFRAKRSGLVHRQNLVVNSWDQLRGFRPVSLLCLFRSLLSFFPVTGTFAPGLILALLFLGLCLRCLFLLSKGIRRLLILLRGRGHQCRRSGDHEGGGILVGLLSLLQPF